MLFEKTQARQGAEKALVLELGQREALGESDPEDLDVASRSSGEGLDVVRIGGRNVVSLPSEKNDSGINDVSPTTEPQKLTSRATESIVERPDFDGDERFGQQRLPRAKAAPGLSDYAAVRQRNVSGELRRFETAPHRAVAALDRNQRPAVENEAHAAPLRRPVRVAEGNPPRTTIAARRSVFA